MQSGQGVESCSQVRVWSHAVRSGCGVMQSGQGVEVHAVSQGAEVPAVMQSGQGVDIPVVRVSVRSGCGGPCSQVRVWRSLQSGFLSDQNVEVRLRGTDSSLFCSDNG